jgi:cell division protein FtsQ
LKINWNIVKTVFLLALVSFLFSFSHRKNVDKKVRDVLVEFEEGENLFMNYEMVNKLLIQNGKTVKNERLSALDLHLLEANLLSHPMVENAAIFLTVDGLLKSKVKQREPIARVISNTDSYYIDRQAKEMPLSLNHSARVVLVSGDIKDEDNKQIHQLVKKIMSNDFLKKQIVGIRKKTNNEFVLETRVDDQKIELGKIENLNKKFMNLESFFKKATIDNSINNYSLINLKYDKQVVCTKR